MPGPFLRRRGGAYRLRVRVPSDLVEILGRTEVGRSLGTADPRASRSRARALHAQLEAAWERIRVAIETGTADPAWCADLVDAALRLAEAANAQVRAESLVAVREAEHLRAVERREAAEQRVAFVARVREGFEGLLSDQERERQQAEQERAAGTLSPENLRAFHGLMGSAGVVMRSTPAPTVLDYLENTYLGERRLGDAGRRHMLGYVRLFAKVLGNRPLNTFERKDILQWVRTLERMPSTYGKGGKDAHKPIDAILREADKAEAARLGRTTIEKHLTHLKAFFLSAVTHHKFATGDEVQGWFGHVVLGKGVPKPRERGIWSPSKLNALFSSPAWTGTRSAASDFGARHQPGPHIHLDAYWWLPVLAIHTGARLEELAQLQHEDFLHDSDGLPFLNLTDDENRQLKNVNSRRAVPIHPLLHELRFPELFKAGGKGRVFGELRLKGREAKWSAAYSQHFTKYRKEVGLYARMVDFHALRHTFITAMREKAAADVGMVATMAGHSRDPALHRFLQTERYTHFSVAGRLAGLERLDWEAQGLDLSHLRRAVQAAGGPRGRVRAAGASGRVAAAAS